MEGGGNLFRELHGGKSFYKRILQVKYLNMRNTTEDSNPMEELKSHLGEIPRGKELCIICLPPPIVYGICAFKYDLDFFC